MSKLSYRQTPLTLTNNIMNQRAEILLCTTGGPKRTLGRTIEFASSMGKTHTSPVARRYLVESNYILCSHVHHQDRTEETLLEPFPIRHGGPGTTQSSPAE